MEDSLNMLLICSWVADHNNEMFVFFGNFVLL